MTQLKKTPSQRALTIAAFACIYLVWGSTFLVIRFTLEALPPFTLGALRFLLAATLLAAGGIIATRKKFPAIPRASLGRALLSGILMPGLGNGLLVYGAQYVPSGTAALWIATVPIFVLIQNWIFFDRRRPAMGATLGAFLGCIGLTLLPGVSMTATQWTVIPALLTAAASWAFGTLIQRAEKRALPAWAVSAVQMAGAGVFLSVVALLHGDWAATRFDFIPLYAFGGVIYLSVVASVLAFTAYSWLVARVDPQKVATYALVNPVIALMLGAWVAGEAITARLILVSGFVLSGVALILFTQSRLGDFRLPRFPTRAHPERSDSSR